MDPCDHLRECPFLVSYISTTSKYFKIYDFFYETWNKRMIIALLFLCLLGFYIVLHSYIPLYWSKVTDNEKHKR